MSDAISQSQVEQLLAEAAQKVLETMFFVTVLGNAPEDAEPVPYLWIQVRFQGNPPGRLRLGLWRAAAQSIATGFFGVEAEDDLSESQVDSVVRELANVICGTALSLLESDSVFELEAPELIPDPGPDDSSGAIRCSLLLDCGTLHLWLSLDSPA
jgi:CheY-specific phosphatase CheX